MANLYPGFCDYCGCEACERHYTEAADGAAAMHCVDCTVAPQRSVFTGYKVVEVEEPPF